MDINSLKLVENQNLASKSITYKIKLPVYKIDEKLIGLLVDLSKENKAKNIRFCFHEGNDSALQQMLILERKEMYYPPHTHKKRVETHIVLRGALEVFILNKNGSVSQRFVNTSEDKFISNVPSEFSHLTRPITNEVIYLEIKNGPHTPFKDDCFIPNPYNKEFMTEKEYTHYLDQFDQLFS